MSNNVAMLGLEVRSDQPIKAATDLDRLTAASKRAEAEALKLASGAQKLASQEAAVATAATSAALGVDGLAVAEARASSSALQAAAANDRLASSLKKTSLNTANVAAQFNDIGVTLASGMSPWMVAIQQGTQLNQVLGNQGLRGTVGLLGGALSSLLNPVSLVTIAVIGLGGTAVQALYDWYASGEKTAEQLKQQEELIRRVADRWGDTIPAVQAYIEQLDKAKEKQDLLSARDAIRDDLYQGAREQLAELTAMQAAYIADLRQVGDEEKNVQALQEAFKNLTNRIADGTAGARDAVAVSDALNDTMLAGQPVSLDLAAALATLAGALAGVSSQARDANSQIGELLNRTGRTKDDNAFPATIRLPGSAPAPTKRTDPYFDDADASFNRAGKAAERARDAYRDLIKNAQDRLNQMRLEVEVAGEVGIKADALRFKQKLLADAMDKGRTISAAQRGEIDKLAEEYARLAEAQAKARLQQDLLFDRQQMFRTSTDQLIADMMRGAGLEIDFDSAIAGAIRLNEQMQQTRELLEDIASEITSGLKDALSDGKLEWRELGDIALNVLQRIADQLIKMATDQIIAGLMRTIFGGLGSGAGGDAWAGLRSTTGSAAVSGSALSAPGGLPAFEVNRQVAEKIAPLRNGMEGRSGMAARAAANRNDAPGNIKVDVGVSVDESGNLQAFVRKVSQETAARGINEFAKSPGFTGSTMRSMREIKSRHGSI